MQRDSQRRFEDAAHRDSRRFIRGRRYLEVEDRGRIDLRWRGVIARDALDAAAIGILEGKAISKDLEDAVIEVLSLDSISILLNDVVDGGPGQIERQGDHRAGFAFRRFLR